MELSEIKQKLLNLPDIEKAERMRVRADYYFYKGKCTNREKAKLDKALLGQNWEVVDNLDYEPTQDIRNKVKPLLKKQAIFMFGNKPDILLKPNNLGKKESCEELRRFIDDILEANKFWKNTRKAFLMSTVKKRVLLRLEANPGMPIKLKYENIEDFFYKEIEGNLVQVSFFEEDRNNVYIDDDKDKIYYIHTYYYKSLENEEVNAWYKRDTFKGDDLENPITVVDIDTGFHKIPCWLIKNGGELGDKFGESDLEDLKDIQMQYNRRISDYADALRFQCNGADSIIDGNPDDVNSINIAPGALHAIRTDDKALEQGKQAVHKRLEYTFSGSDAINAFLERAIEDMNAAMDMPRLKDLNNVPSAKAMKYLYNDLIARCEEKFSDWDPVFSDLIEFIKVVARYCYTSYKAEWDSLEYTTLFTHNYPIPSDEEDKKKLAIEEVKANVRSIQSYLQDLSEEEDPKKAFMEIIEEKKTLNESEIVDSFQDALNNEPKDKNKDNKQKDNPLDDEPTRKDPDGDE